MSSQLNMNELFETSNNKTLRRLELYDSILQKCHSRIKYYSKHEHTMCCYPIPEFIIGMPLYDVSELRKFIMNSLTKNGFKIMYIEPNWLVINWENNNRKLTNMQNKTEVKNTKSNYKPIEDYKPTGGLIYDQSSMMSMADKSKKILTNGIGVLNI
jgi:hypothetical protein